MSEAIIPYGGTVEVSSDGSIWDEIPECRGIPVPTKTQEYPEVTSLDSPNGYREYVAGLKDGGELSFEANYTEPGMTLIEGLDGVEAYVRCTFPLQPSQTSAGDVFTFRAFLTATPNGTDVGAPVSMTINARVTGARTYIAGS